MGNVLEHRCAEIRLAEDDGAAGVIAGRALPYRVEARLPWGLERAEGPGRIQYAPVVMANLHHRREAPLGRLGANLSFTDGDDGLDFSLRLPETRAGEDTARLVRDGILGGASIEFRALKDRIEGGVRILERILLTGLAIVDVPAYSAATIEARCAALHARLRPYW